MPRRRVRGRLKHHSRRVEDNGEHKLQMNVSNRTPMRVSPFKSDDNLKAGERLFPENYSPAPQDGTVQGALTSLYARGLNKVKDKIQKIRTKTKISDIQPYNPNTD